jgi:branched-subunit amino acid aminotransferase/4-amino-4-deoxychorismate lyase
MSAVYETMRVKDGAVPLLERHMERFVDGCAATGLPVPADVQDRISDVLAVCPGDVGLRLEWDGSQLQLTFREIPSRAPMEVVTVSVPHPGYRVKTTDREAFETARAEAQGRGAHEGLLLTSDGFVAEGTLFAVAWFEGDTLRVPSLDLAILPSIGRARIIEVAAFLGLRVEEGAFGIEELYDRPALAVTATRGVFTIRSVDGRPVPPDERIQRLADAFWP